MGVKTAMSIVASVFGARFARTRYILICAGSEAQQTQQRGRGISTCRHLCSSTRERRPGRFGRMTAQYCKTVPRLAAARVADRNIASRPRNHSEILLDQMPLRRYFTET